MSRNIIFVHIYVVYAQIIWVSFKFIEQQTSTIVLRASGCVISVQGVWGENLFSVLFVRNLTDELDLGGRRHKTYKLIRQDPQLCVSCGTKPNHTERRDLTSAFP
jgi:hypothetical protein